MLPSPSPSGLMINPSLFRCCVLLQSTLSHMAEPSGPPSEGPPPPLPDHDSLPPASTSPPSPPPPFHRPIRAIFNQVDLRAFHKSKVGLKKGGLCSRGGSVLHGDGDPFCFVLISVPPPRTGQTYSDFMGFIRVCNDGVKGLRVSDHYHVSPVSGKVSVAVVAPLRCFHP